VNRDSIHPLSPSHLPSLPLARPALSPFSLSIPASGAAPGGRAPERRPPRPPPPPTTTRTEVARPPLVATARSPLSPPMSARRSGAAAAGRPARVRRRGGEGRAAGGQDQGSGAARGRTRRLRHAAAHMAGSSIPASSCGFAGGGGRIRADPLRGQAPRRGGHSCGPPAPPPVSLSLSGRTTAQRPKHRRPPGSSPPLAVVRGARRQRPAAHLILVSRRRWPRCPPRHRPGARRPLPRRPPPRRSPARRPPPRPSAQALQASSFSGISGIPEPEPEFSGTRIVGFFFFQTNFG